MPNENEVAQAVAPVQNDIIIGTQMDVSTLTLEERVELFKRFSEAQASTQINEDALNTDLVATDMTIYQRDYVDPDTGFVGLATYTSFVLADGRKIKTASSQAVPFATSVAKFIGYDPKNGHLPVPIKFQIIPQRAETGFKYVFVFKDIVA